MSATAAAAAGAREPGREVLELMTGSWLSQALFVAAELGIADLLVDGPVHVVDLATASGCQDADGLYRVLRLLASHDVFMELDDRRFALSAMATRLRSDVPGSMRDLVIFYGAESYQAWGELLHAVRTGNSPFRTVFGDDLFTYLGSRPERRSVFNGTMAASAPFFEHLATRYPFAPGSLVVDVGGGSGAMLAAILAAHPDVRGIVFDAAGVVDEADARFAAQGLSDRGQVVPGDFFQHVPPSGDVYMLSRILQDWDDDGCIRILRNCRSAMAADSRLLIVERPLPPPNTTSLANEFDVQMLVTSPSGRGRTIDEYRHLLGRAGFAVLTTIPLIYDVSVVECAPVPSGHRTSSSR
jgi:O-methyltransferase domain/Dimerisation domain